MQTQKMTSKAYNCPLTQKHVQVQLNNQAMDREPEVCSSIGQCGCDVVEIIYGMSYTVDWKKCCLYSIIKGQELAN
ncbi:hypothetical protein [Candidatus Electrothrix sp.]|uniref:hypothetical protein n=1 Tax=Candidatus Electrothrix sp. TaxID=2170559 RepID=UPI004055CE81